MKHKTHLSCQSEYRSALVHSSRMSLAWIICMAVSVGKKMEDDQISNKNTG